MTCTRLCATLSDLNNRAKQLKQKACLHKSNVSSGPWGIHQAARSPTTQATHLPGALSHSWGRQLTDSCPVPHHNLTIATRTTTRTPRLPGTSVPFLEPASPSLLLTRKICPCHCLLISSRSLGLDSMYSPLRKYNTQFQPCLATHRVLMRSMSHEYCLI